MCGRFANHVKDMGRWADILGDWPGDVTTSYNIAPSADVAVFTEAGGSSMRWGLIPAWSKTPQIKYATYNARAESLASKPAYRSAWKHCQRCLIPAQGYYEWQTEGGKKQPSYIRAANDAPLMFAGLWDQYDDGEQPIRSCTIITCPATTATAALHPRMPLIIGLNNAECWLKGDKAECADILIREPEVELMYYRVSTLVNNPRNQGEELIQEYRD